MDERVKDILADARLVDQAGRGAYLDRVCGGDARLRAEVESLLAALDGAGSFFDGATPLAPPNPDGETPGSRIGRYRLTERIGHGGFGAVWIAEQLEPVRRRVALKIIKLGMDTREVVARFEAERQALALMEHPNIARILDGGVTSNGRPYFVMELVPGTPLIRFCAEHKLPTRERLELFVQICLAVQHAHQKGVIHRDLKPSNIIVALQDGRPIPKIIDFGVAKAIQEPLTEKTLMTGLHQWLGTPAYMSPEQAGGTSQNLDARSDVYALGILLYELLTGHTPVDTRALLALGPDVVLRAIREQELPKPSTRLSKLTGEEIGALAAERRVLPEKLAGMLRGDLDWIVMKCLEKDRTRRYGSAQSLATDLQHYLANEPVLAGPPSELYLLKKFIRRNQLVLAAVGVILVLGLVTMVSVWQAVLVTRTGGKALAQARIAEPTAQTAPAQRAEQVGEVEPAPSEPLTNAPALVKSDTFSPNSNLTAAARAEWNKTKLTEGEKHFTETIALMRQNLGDTNAVLGDLYFEFGDFLFFNEQKPGAAVEQYRKALAIRQAVPDDELMVLLFHLGNALDDAADLREAEKYIREGLDLHERLHDWENYQSVQPRLELGFILAGQQRLPEAEEALQKALAACAKWGPEGRQLYATILRRLVTVLKAENKLSEGEALCQKVLAENRTPVRTNAPVVISALGGLADLLSTTSRKSEAEAAITEAIRLHTKSVAGDAPNQGERLDHVHLLWELSGILSLMRRFDEAERVQRDSVQLCEGVHRDFPNQVFTTQEYAMSQRMLGQRLQDAGRLEQAVRELQTAVILYQKGLDDFPNESSLRSSAVAAQLHLARALEDVERYREAENVYQRALLICGQMLSASSTECAQVSRSLHRLLRIQSKLGHAEAHRRPSTNDLWDISRGVVINNCSPLLRLADDERDLFGGHFSPPLEDQDLRPGFLMFADGNPDGFVNYVEWTTPTPVTIHSFNLWANGDDDGVREMAGFRLLAKAKGSSTYNLTLFTFTPNHPYQWIDGVSNLLLSTDINSTTAQEFRAEFVNHVTPTAPAYAPRVIELDGFGDVTPARPAAPIPPN